jgi:ribosomal protein S27E
MSRKSRKPDPGSYSLGGKSVNCPHCGGSQFAPGKAQLNTAFATLIELDWIDKSAFILTCTSCGQIQWFAEEPARES